jgi:hypothetical protein
MSLTIAGVPLSSFHVCAFFNSKDEEYAVLTPFYKEGIEQREKAVHIVSPDMLGEHRSRLDTSGIAVCDCEESGQMEVVDWDEAYLDENGVFDKDRMLGIISGLTEAGRKQGFMRTRVMGDMNWVFDGVPGADDIIRYEAEVNEVLARNEQAAVCVYDVSKLSGAMMLDLLRTHPLVLVGGILQENLFYTPPQELLAELSEREAAAPQSER